MIDRDADLYARLATLSKEKRAALINFLGAEPKSDGEAARIAEALIASLNLNARSRQDKLN